jgi:hypothetical protein
MENLEKNIQAHEGRKKRHKRKEKSKDKKKFNSYEWKA